MISAMLNSYGQPDASDALIKRLPKVDTTSLIFMCRFIWALRPSEGPCLQYEQWPMERVINGRRDRGPIKVTTSPKNKARPPHSGFLPNTNKHSLPHRQVESTVGCSLLIDRSSGIFHRPLVHHRQPTKINNSKFKGKYHQIIELPFHCI